MDGMILAAGLGTRLRPLTAHLPKALVDVGGTTMLERTARRLVEAGVDRIVVNVHHHADQVEAFLRSGLELGVEVLVSREANAPLDTGGGLLAARALLRGDRAVLVHNVDVFTDLDLGLLARDHAARTPLATLAVMDRPTTRHLLFDDRGLVGRDDQGRGIREVVRPAEGAVRALGFSGVHVLAPALLARLDALAGTAPGGTFPLLVPWLAAAAAGERLLPHRVDGATWVDVGRPEGLAEARARAARPGAAGSAPGR